MIWLGILTFLNLLLTIYLYFLLYRIRTSSPVTASKTTTSSDISFYQTIVHYQPFSDATAAPSFSLCLLDKEKSGVIITSINSRDRSRVYAKVIKGGQPSGQPLSPEENDCLQKILIKLHSAPNEHKNS